MVGSAWLALRAAGDEIAGNSTGCGRSACITGSDLSRGDGSRDRCPAGHRVGAFQIDWRARCPEKYLVTAPGTCVRAAPGTSRSVMPAVLTSSAQLIGAKLLSGRTS